MSRTRAATVALMGATAVVATALPDTPAAEAHGSSMWTSTWSTNSISMYMSSDFPDAWADQMGPSRDYWPLSTGRPATGFYSSSDTAYSADCTNYSTNRNRINRESIDGYGDTFAVTCRGVSNGEIVRVQLTFDADDLFYAGDNPPPSNRVDFKNTAVHELGHVWGLTHFPASDTVCNSDPKHTMCPYSDYGEYHMRSPEEHDIHSLSNAY